MRQWAAQQGFPADPSTTPTFQSEYQLNQNTMAYSLYSPNEGYETNGIAYMQPNGTNQNIFFGREEITMPTQDHSLETTILNFYTAHTVK